ADASAAANGTPAPQTEPAEATGVIRNAWTVGFWTIASRLLGLYRFRLMAGIFGASGVADAFNFAFVFPNLTRRLFGEGLLSSVFVPVFSGMLAKGQKEAANRTASVLLCRLAYWLTAGCVVVMVLAGAARVVLPDVMTLDPRFRLELELFQWLLPYLIFINVAAVLMAILNSLKHFGVPAFAPVLLNVLMIAACWWVRYGPAKGGKPEDQIWLVAYAVLLGGTLQLLVQAPPAFARGFRFHPGLDATDPGYQEVMHNFKPVVLMVAVFQANVLLDNIIAQVFIPEPGPVTYLNMGTSLYQLPWSIFSLAIGTAALPALSHLWAQGRREDFSKTLLSSLRVSIYLAVPCTIGLMLLSDEIVRLLYGTGRFLENDAEPVHRTARVVMFSSLGLVFYSVNSLLARALYAMKDMRTPTTTSAQSVAINLALNLLFVVGLAAAARVLIPYRDSLGAEQKVWRAVVEFLIALGSLKEGGIALASALSNGWQTWMLARAVRQKLALEGKPDDASGESFLTLGLAGVVSALAGFFAYRYFVGRPDWEGFWAFFAAVLGSLVPFCLFCRQYFISKLENKPHDDPALHRYGVREEHWPEILRFQHSLYTAATAGAIMGFMVWAVRDSLPPEGSFIPVLQRALVPVVIGVLVFSSASSGLMAREYDELKGSLGAKLSELKAALAAKLKRRTAGS
ncbi:MAG: murein biosynthesis integral membrane protein MurJ, partial [Planctomycetota bacterium]|nr:murein biosynthesis integral membrane protein MurJ [Planctomycetota bacterium]